MAFCLMTEMEENILQMSWWLVQDPSLLRSRLEPRFSSAAVDSTALDQTTSADAACQLG